MNSERITQNRIVKLFQQELGYALLFEGNLHDRAGNSNIEEIPLTLFLQKQGYSKEHISKAVDKLHNEANNHQRDLYFNNMSVYDLLHYGVSVKMGTAKQTDAIWLIDWKNPLNNDFYIAEEVTIKGIHDKRPDVVLYVNGIALAVIELKKSSKDIGEGIRQNLTNQQTEFIQDFFSTIQFCFAGSDSEGLRYGTIETSAKYYLTWREDEQLYEPELLDKYLKKICSKERFLEIIHDFVLFDDGRKKLPRYHQYFGIKAAQQHVLRKESGIIWHTQGSGKSITMVLLAKWILANNPDARIAIITDRTELDAQIKKVFSNTGEKTMERAKSGEDLMHKLSQPSPRLICSLVHKFGKSKDKQFDEFIKEIENNRPNVKGELFVFVDECHRTQSGRLHNVMKAILPNAVFIGFTGTPLLKQDKQTSLEVFGKYIHTYKFNEAVEDKVVLDLVYEARDIDQRISSQDHIDLWFDAKTKGLNDFQRAELKKKWGTMQKVLSSKSRMGKVVNDIILDFSVKPRLNDDRGTAILVAGSIYEACQYYELFQLTHLKSKCGIITSYNPSTRHVVNEELGENTETEKQAVYNIYTKILGKRATEEYEEETKDLFIKHPAKMKLLIVVSRLLTGFDAPSCTYLYIDKSMQDHGLFQAICRVNRLDTDDKELGYIVDYKDLFKNLVNDKGTGAIQVYTSELAYDQFKKEDCDILLQSRLEKARERLDTALEQLELICEPVANPKDDAAYRYYFCGNTELPEDLKEREFLRQELYKKTVAFIRAYANLADEMEAAGYNAHEIQHIDNRLKFYIDLREAIKNASGEKLDMKDYEADMRHLIDNYLHADEPRQISEFESLSLLEIITKLGLEKAKETLPEAITADPAAMAETIENNVRTKIVKEHLTDPVFFEKMSLLLSEIIKQRKAKAIDYEEYLKQIAALAKQVQEGKTSDTPRELDSPAKVVLYHYFDQDVEKALMVHDVVVEYAPSGWKGDSAKENKIKEVIYKKLNDFDETVKVFDVIKEQGEYLK
ncbi:type I restriction endonuclease subunit R [Parachryseolinea silvisoli]|uniref:type I restriction endonuclease subunit R n=1 Tax=Parachryseolinea silvisoli TaxID=2873601 RepID=UPI002265A52D|nr:HsdR family type I site-specific deoxyribonuclease [Parachryseolinea silvisoli]MCD9017516.1 HsdR family type I site-specific deoxyribonuclease [Parachryseolinea silvisoli]